MEHTKGEWEAMRGWTSWYEGDLYFIQKAQGIPSNKPLAYVYNEANARLIASAPDLYEVCKALLAERINIGIDKPFWTPSNKERLEQAIAKAEK